MRQWMVNPAIMCRQHLLGEHVEIRMFIGAMRKGTSMQGYCRDNLMEPSALESRHTELVAEMTARGYKHKSEVGYVPLLPPAQQATMIDREKTLAELVRRCPTCRTMLEQSNATQKRD